jgi:hypothetical protein
MKSGSEEVRKPGSREVRKERSEAGAVAFQASGLPGFLEKDLRHEEEIG